MFADMLDGEEEAEEAAAQQELIMKDKMKKKPGMRELLKNKVLRRPLIIIPIIWLTVDMVYFGINFSL